MYRTIGHEGVRLYYSRPLVGAVLGCNLLCIGRSVRYKHTQQQCNEVSHRTDRLCYVDSLGHLFEFVKQCNNSFQLLFVLEGDAYLTLSLVVARELHLRAEEVR